MEFVASKTNKTVFGRLSLVVNLHQDVSPSSLLLPLSLLKTVAFANSEFNSSHRHLVSLGPDTSGWILLSW